MPTEYTGQFLQIREGTPQAPETVGARLSADDGTTADVSFTLSGPPAAPSGSAKCGGEDFDQATTDDATSAGTLEIVGTGAAELTVDQIITVTDGPPPPVCEERAGTWTGNADGELAGRSGTFTVVSTHSGNTGRSTLTLQEE